MFERLKSVNLNNAQKRALFKIAVDMVKIDNRIHRNEVSILDSLQQICGISTEELELIHYIPLQRSIKTLLPLDSESRNIIISVIEAIVGIDNDIDIKENLLLSAIKMVLGDKYHTWCSVISVTGVEAECSSSQIVYLEREYCENAHVVLDDLYDNLLITKALNDVSLQLFYLPNVVNELCKHWGYISDGGARYNLLRRSMDFIVPAGDQMKLDNLSSILKNLDITTFYKIVSSHYRISPDQIDFSAFFMVKIQDGYILDDDARLQRTVDFLIIDATTDVKRRILSMVDMMESPVCLLSYEGYYRLLYEHLSSESKIMSAISLDDRYEFYLKDLSYQPVKIESSPQARTFYILLLWYGHSGISQQCFEKALQYLENYLCSANCEHNTFMSRLLAENSPHCLLIYNIITIYQTLSEKEPDNSNYALYAAKIIKHRSALKNYINNGFSKITRLANCEQYYIAFNNDTRSYNIGLSIAYIEKRNSQGETFPITQSCLWKKLK